MKVIAAKNVYLLRLTFERQNSNEKQQKEARKIFKYIPVKYKARSLIIVFKIVYKIAVKVFVEFK